MDNPLPDKWDALRRAAEAATPGPWIATEHYVWQRKGEDDLGLCLTTGYDSEFSKQDAAFIASASPDVIQELLSKLSKAHNSSHWYNPETGQAECECCCGAALDYDAMRKRAELAESKLSELRGMERGGEGILDRLREARKSLEIHGSVRPNDPATFHAYSIIDTIIDELATLSVTDGWIDCKQKLPPTEDSVLTFGHTEKATQSVVNEWRPEVARYLSGKYWTNSHIYVTHWMPLPKPPQLGVDGREK